MIGKQVGIVFQNPDSQFVGAMVEEDIAFGLENNRVSYKEMLEEVKTIAEKLNLTDLLKREPTNATCRISFDFS